MNYEMKHYIVGPIATNCYFMCNMDTKEMILVDPGDQAEVLKLKITESGCTPVAILLTHGHTDHVLAVNKLREDYHVKVYAHEWEREEIEREPDAMARSLGAVEMVKVDEYIHGEPVLDLAGFKIKVLSTPGHTVGGCCYYLEEQKILFSGDTLFNGSVGRTDFAGGSMSKLIASIEQKLFTLPEDVEVFPGHEASTTIGFEKKFNPYF